MASRRNAPAMKDGLLVGLALISVSVFCIGCLPLQEPPSGRGEGLAEFIRRKNIVTIPTYSLQAFHDELVKQGNIPIRAIRRILLPGDKGPTL